MLPAAVVGRGQREQIAAGHASRERFLTELTLDPPDSTSDRAGPPHRDEDFLVLSTIHSAKGQEWAKVFVLNAVDGCIPSDLATGEEHELPAEVVVDASGRGSHLPAWLEQRGYGRPPESGHELGLTYTSWTFPREPGDMDGALLLLAGPSSSYLTGQTVVVDGGLSAGW